MIFLFFLELSHLPWRRGVVLPESSSRIRALRSMPAHSETQREDIGKD